jgi:hypothetical protein
MVIPMRKVPHNLLDGKAPQAWCESRRCGRFIGETEREKVEVQLSSE